MRGRPTACALLIRPAGHAMFTRVLTAVDFDDATATVIRHAAGLANAAQATLTLLHVARGRTTTEDARALLQREFRKAVPHEAAYAERPALYVVRGERATAILTAAARIGADVIVTGSRGLSNPAGWKMGSTTRLLMEATAVPLLIVPATSRDSPTLRADRAQLHVGAIMAAVDLRDVRQAHLPIASALAALTHQSLLLMTALDTEHSVADAADELRHLGQSVWPVRPSVFVVQRGDVAQEIARAVSAEGAGLVVMGLQDAQRGLRPGRIATAVIERTRALVLVVPDLAHRSALASAPDPSRRDVAY
jgi:nucleotide-binding universal stress UspA family protein